MPSHAVVWHERGQLFDIHSSGDGSSCARAINGAGLVVGEGAHGGNNRAWVWSADSGLVPLDTRIQSLPDIRVEHAAGINAFGQIAGWGWDAAAGQSRALLLTPVAAVPEPAPAALRCAGLLVPAWRRPGKRPA